MTTSLRIPTYDLCDALLQLAASPFGNLDLSIPSTTSSLIFFLPAHVSCPRLYVMVNLLLALSSATSFVTTSSPFAFQPHHTSWISGRLPRPRVAVKRVVRSRGCPDPIFPKHGAIWTIRGIAERLVYNQNSAPAYTTLGRYRVLNLLIYT